MRNVRYFKREARSSGVAGEEGSSALGEEGLEHLGDGGFGIVAA
jgi:hypothetical protein